MTDTEKHSNVISPRTADPEGFTDAGKAVARLQEIYQQATKFLATAFSETRQSGAKGQRFRAYYPEIRLTCSSYSMVDSRLSFGHVAGPGTYATTVTRPDLFANYLRQQISLLLENHQAEIFIGPSKTPIPIHFALLNDPSLSASAATAAEFSLRDVFDVPDLTTTNDDIVNGVVKSADDGTEPLGPFTAQRVDYSLARLAHYTATDVEHFQNYVLFTNYQFYVSEFEAYARQALADPKSGYTSFVSPGNQVITDPKADIPNTSSTPQMPTYHLTRENGNGITLVNIGVGPSNAKTATDHIAVLRPHAWVMLGHCAGAAQLSKFG